MSEEEFICPICHENTDLPKFKLPECSHEFHCECIMHWFRHGNTKCPLCNNIGHVANLNNQGNPNIHMSRLYNMHTKTKFLRKYSQRKDCDPMLKQYVIKIREAEQKLRDLNAEYKEHREHFVGNYKEFLKEKQRYSVKRRRILGKSRMIMREMCEFPIAELIIVRRITLMDD